MRENPFAARMAFIGYIIFLLSDINMIEMKINCVLYVMKM